MAADAFAERMRQLSQQFLAGLAEDLAVIVADRTQAAAIVHRIAGRAGTFGFPEISERASDLETAIASDGVAGTSFEAGLAALTHSAARAVAGPA